MAAPAKMLPYRAVTAFAVLSPRRLAAEGCVATPFTYVLKQVLHRQLEDGSRATRERKPCIISLFWGCRIYRLIVSQSVLRHQQIHQLNRLGTADVWMEVYRDVMRSEVMQLKDLAAGIG